MSHADHQIALSIYPCIINEDNSEVCSLDIGLFAVTCISCFIYGVGCLFGIYVFYYRWQHRLFTGLRHRVDGYQMPRPLDSLLACLIIHTLANFIVYSLTIAGWPPSQMLRDVLVLLCVAMIFVALSMFMASSVVHIPSIFVQRISSNRRYCRTMGDRVINPHQTIRVPSTKILHFIVVWFNPTLLVFAVPLGIWLGIASDRHDHLQIARAMTTISTLIIVMAIFMIYITSYYCYGFYKILSKYVQPSTRNEPLSKDEVKAAYHFRNIFLLMVIYCGFTALMTLPVCIFLTKIEKVRWIYYIVVVIHHIILFPSLSWGIFIIGLQSSRNRVQQRIFSLKGSLKGTGSLTNSMPDLDLMDEATSRGTLFWQSLFANNQHMGDEHDRVSIVVHDSNNGGNNTNNTRCYNITQGDVAHPKPAHITSRGHSDSLVMDDKKWPIR